MTPRRESREWNTGFYRLVRKGAAPVELDLAKLMKVVPRSGVSVGGHPQLQNRLGKAYEQRNWVASTPVTTKTLFQAGSISKPVAATGMLALVQQGKLSLDEDVNVKLKTWRVAGERVYKRAESDVAATCESQRGADGARIPRV